MKHKILFLLFLFLNGRAYCQLPVSADSIYRIIKQRSVFSSKADWTNIDTAFASKLLSAKNDIDSIRSLVYVFVQLGDVHSNILYNGRQYGNYPDFDDATLQYLLPLVKRSQEQEGLIKTSIIQGKYAYIQVPGIQAWGDKVNEYAQLLADSICKLSSNKITGFIIDLRLNSGGQLSSMLSGLNLLLGNTYLGGGVSGNGTELNRFDMIKGNFSINKIPMTAIKNKCNTGLSDKPVVVLIGPATRSSGSITAIAFKKRPETYFIGEPTADGYSTGNDYFYLGATMSMNLSTLYSQDRAKNIYPHSVPPDMIIKGGDNFDSLSNDSKIQVAIEWFKKGR